MDKKELSKKVGAVLLTTAIAGTIIIPTGVFAANLMGQRNFKGEMSQTQIEKMINQNSNNKQGQNFEKNNQIKFNKEEVKTQEIIEESSNETTEETVTTEQNSVEEQTETITVSTYDGESDNIFTFSDSGITVAQDGSGYKIEGTSLTITESGIYVITGSCSEGGITVKKGTTGVILVLQDLTLSSSQAAPLSCNKTTETTLNIVGNVVLTDNEDASTEDTNEDFEGAAIKVKSGATLTITGTGILTADGSNCKNGIKGAATAEITVDGNVTLNVKAANNGIASDGSVVINSGKVNIVSGNDGIKAEPDEDDTESAGTVTINGGTITINSNGDAIQATNDVTITGGTFNITTFGGYTRAKSLGEESAKGIKSDSEVVITGGTFNLNCADDSIHSNGNVTLKGGNYTIYTGDDAIHSDNDLTINDGSIIVKSSYEGLEGARIYLNGGSANITASDDGVNVATDESVSEIAIYINDGTWYINASGDGLDAGGDSRNNSGGNIIVNGGTTEVYGSADNGNSALDFDGTLTYNSGTLLAVGMSGMAQAPSSGTYIVFGSSQMGMGAGQMNMGFGGNNNTTSGVTVTKGNTIEIKDSSGNTIYTATATKNANSIIFASDKLASNETYTLYVDGTQKGTATVSQGSTNGFGMQQGNMQMPSETNDSQMLEMEQANIQIPNLQNNEQKGKMIQPNDNQVQETSLVVPEVNTTNEEKNILNFLRSLPNNVLDWLKNLFQRV